MFSNRLFTFIFCFTHISPSSDSVMFYGYFPLFLFTFATKRANIRLYALYPPTFILNSFHLSAINRTPESCSMAHSDDLMNSLLMREWIIPILCEGHCCLLEIFNNKAQQNANTPITIQIHSQPDVHAQMPSQKYLKHMQVHVQTSHLLYGWLIIVLKYHL